jgi:Glycosyl hydrolases family 16
VTREATIKRRRVDLAMLLAGVAVLAVAAPARPDPAMPLGAARRSTVVETWTRESPAFHATHDRHPVAVRDLADAADGRALELRLDARPEAGPGQGVEIASDRTYRYGTFGSRLKAADCTGQEHAGIVTGVFTYSTDHADDNGNGLQDNDEIDIEFLCAQPRVVYLSIWTDYDEPTDTPRKISRAVDLSTGTVLLNCWSESWGGPCAAPMPGEDRPASVTAVPGFDAAARFRSYRFDWTPDRVTFYVSADDGRRILLWDYRGPVDRIPRKPGRFLQNVWHTPSWDPFGVAAHDRPDAAVSAYVDSSTVPRADP